MGSCLQLSIFSGSSCFCWLCPSFYLPLWVPMPKATVMHQLNTTETSSDTATTATLYLMVTGLDTVTMAMQHPMDMSPEPDMGTTAILLMATSPDMATTATLRMSPDTATTATLRMSPDTATMVTLRMSPDTATTATLPMRPDTATTATLLMRPDTATTATLPMRPDTATHPMRPDTVTTATLPMSPDTAMTGNSSYGYRPRYSYGY